LGFKRKSAIKDYSKIQEFNGLKLEVLAKV
jgi:hypothetical protein